MVYNHHSAWHFYMTLVALLELLLRVEVRVIIYPHFYPHLRILLIIW